MARISGVENPGLSLAALVFAAVERKLGKVVRPLRIHALSPGVLELADGMSASPADIDEDLFGALRSLFSDEQMVEVASAIAWENDRARFNYTA